MKRKVSFLVAGWSVVILSVIAHHWWVEYVLDHLRADTLIEYDAVLFGPIPIALACLWFLLLIYLLIRSFRYWFFERDR